MHSRAFADTGKIAAQLRQKLETAQSGKLWVGCEIIHAGANLIDFYRNRNFAPVWVNARGANALGDSLPRYLLAAKEQGLNPEDYHYRCIKATLDNFHNLGSQNLAPAPDDLADLDILLTDAFMTYASHLVGGKVNPESIYPLWFSKKHKADILAGLNHLLVSHNLEQTLRSFAPPHRQYWQLYRAAKQMHRIVAAGGWPAVPGGETLHPGDSDPRIPALRKRLTVSGDLPAGAAGNPRWYGPALQEAVKRFQARHGLAVDGVVGPHTFRALNVSAQRRYHQLLLNMERWRWVPRHWTDRYIIVNTAAFELTAYEQGQPVLSSRVIVGKEYRETPVFSRPLRYLEINPYWNVPHSIAVKELLPEIKKDPDYLSKNHFQLLVTMDGSTVVVNPQAVSWDTITASNFLGRIRQLPGKWNALGHIKFMFPNRFHVYMHDTPNRKLFNRPQRDFSHGCIRVEKALDLALLLLQDDPSWSRDRIEQLIADGNRRVVNIPDRWMVHLLYWTAWVGNNGEIQFRTDIYNRDPVLWQALVRSNTGSSPASLERDNRTNPG